MSIKQTIMCDKTEKVLDPREQVLMSICTIQFKDVDKRSVIIEGTDKREDMKFVKNLENYAFHICSEQSQAFLEHVNKFFEKKVKV